MQPDLKDADKKFEPIGRIQDLIEFEKKLFRSSLRQVSGLAKYLRANWKVAVPTVAALSAGAILLRVKSRKIAK